MEKTKKTKRGAPPKPASQRKGNALQVRLTESERSACDTAAKKAGQKLSAWARDALINAAKKS